MKFRKLKQKLLEFFVRIMEDTDHDVRCVITSEVMEDPVLLVETGFS